MAINRAYSQEIQDDDRSQILREFGITRFDALAVGTEAEVYDRDESSVLKIYAGADRLGHIETLRAFYENLDEKGSGIHLPRILDVAQRGNHVVVIEARLDGEPLEVSLSQLSDSELYRVEALYLDAAGALRRIAVTETPKTYMLFDSTKKSDTSRQSFAAFYASALEEKLASVSSIFDTLSDGFSSRATELVIAIRNQSEAVLAVAHGDFYPGNVLANNAKDRITGVIDFGSFTLFGSHLLDLAGAFSYYQMYSAERRAIRQRMLPRVLERIPKDEERYFFQFVLSNAILTSTLYVTETDPRDNGHFQWAAELVAEEEYWERAL